jgi:hypothetical protein
MATPATPRPAARVPTAGSGWIAFAGVMLMVAGAIDVLNAIWAFRHDDNAFTAAVWDNLTAWGVIYLLVGIGLIVTGYYIWQRAPWAIMTGIVVATIGAIMHAFWLFSYPLASIILVGLNVLVIYGLVVYGSEEEAAY